MYDAHRRAVCLLAGLATLTAAALARADIATAEGLFREGRALMQAGEIARACAKFAESQRLDPSAGTLLNLARCHQEQGKTASAWAEYLAAKRAAEAQQRGDMAAEAAQRAESLRPTLSTMTLSVDSPPPEFVVRRNEEVVEAAALDSRLPIDPGRYTIEVTAPGHRSWTAEVVVEGDADHEVVTVPKLIPLPKTAPDAAGGATGPVGSSPTDPGTGERGEPPTSAYVVGGAGVVVTGVGLAFGGLAKAKYDDAIAACPTRTGCSANAIELRADADTFANVANVAVPLGLLGLGVGVVMFLTHDSPSERGTDAVSVIPVASPGLQGALLTGVF